MMEGEHSYLAETYYFDYQSEPIQYLIEEFKDLDSPQERVKGLYSKIRDGWRYNPYVIGFRDKHFRASFIASKDRAHCIDKSILLVAALRAVHIQARLRLAKVSNHIATERLEKKLGSNVIAPHGLVEVKLGGKWSKCSPAFNRELCEMYEVDPLDFDGTRDSVMQEYNRNAQKFMHYLDDYGHFADVPLDFILETFSTNYPAFYKRCKDSDSIDLSKEL